MRNLKLLTFILSVFLFACSSTPKLSERKVSDSETINWLKQYCSSSAPEKSVQGEMVMRANTQEFKGQFPASIKVEKDGKFVLEVTNIIGGTLVQVAGDEKSLQVKSSSKPKYNRAGVEYYMGIPAKILVQLIRGDLPCPSEADRKKVVADGSSMVIDTGDQKWAFKRVQAEHGELPGRIKIEPQKIDLSIDEWDFEKNYARKVNITTDAGTLKWTWKSRELK